MSDSKEYKEYCTNLCQRDHKYDEECKICHRSWVEHHGHLCPKTFERGCWLPPAINGDANSVASKNLSDNYCGSSCQATHWHDGNCNLCNISWINHSGHICSGTSQRGSFQITSKTNLPQYCDSSCRFTHYHDGNCIFCHESWNSHSGHFCPRRLNRGSFKITPQTDLPSGSICTIL